MKLRVATGQFPVGRRIEKNLAYVLRQIQAAARRKADVVLFSEAALGGYAGIDFRSFEGYDWAGLRRATLRVMEAARQHRVWVIVGSNHRLSGNTKPHNSLYVIDPEGRVADRYDKRFLAGPDLDHYHAGTRAVVTEIQGVRAGFLICHEWRYPELYRLYKKRGVDVVFQAWYDGALSAKGWRREGALFSSVIPSAVQGHAAANHYWVCGANTSKRLSCFGGFVVEPDGGFLVRQARHRPGVVVATIDTESHPLDMAALNRPRAMRGVERLGPALRDPRSADRHCI